MNRREFIKTLAGAVAGAFVLRGKATEEEDLGKVAESAMIQLRHWPPAIIDNLGIDLAKGQDRSVGMLIYNDPAEDIEHARDKWELYDLRLNELRPGETAYAILYNWTMYFDLPEWDIHMSIEQYVRPGVLLSCTLTRPDSLLSGEGRVVEARRRDDLWHLHIKGTSLMRECEVPLRASPIPGSLRVRRIGYPVVWRNDSPWT